MSHSNGGGRRRSEGVERREEKTKEEEDSHFHFCFFNGILNQVHVAHAYNPSYLGS
jgi:hypothetical protein